MRVLFSSIGAIGHIYPMVPLAQALVYGGHEVRWACSPDLCPLIEQAGIDAVPAGLPAAARRVARDRRFAELTGLTPDQKTDVLAPWTFGELLPAAMLSDLLPVVREWRPALMINEPGERAGPIVATAVGTVHVTHSYGPQALERRATAVSERLAPLWKQVGCEPRPYGGLYDHLYIDIYPPSIQTAGGAYIARRQLLRSVPYPPSEGTELPSGLAIDSDLPLIYVTSGTEISDDGPLRLVIEAIGGLDVRMVATVGGHRDPRTFGPQRPGIAIEQFIPQTAILPHASAVASHGGSGTVLATLAFGLPQLCLPYSADQPINARAVAGAGAGLALEVASLNQTAVTEALTTLLSEPSFTEQAKKLAAEIAAMPSPEDVAAVLTELAVL